MAFHINANQVVAWVIYSPGLRFAGPPSLRLRRIEGRSIYTKTLALSALKRREGRPAKRCRGEFSCRSAEAAIWTAPVLFWRI